jgi:hypothetical protein
VRLEHRERAGVAVHRVIKQQPDPVARPDAQAADQVPSDPVGRRVQFVEGQPGRGPVDGERAAAARAPQLVAAVLEQVLEALAVPPADAVVPRGREDLPAGAGIEHHVFPSPDRLVSLARSEFGIYTRSIRMGTGVRIAEAGMMPGYG